MKTTTDCFKVTLRRAQIEGALVQAAIKEEGNNKLKATHLSGLQSWWFELNEYGKVPSEVTIYLVDLPSKKEKTPLKTA